MATRCTIIVGTSVEDASNIYIYKHYDGYPEGTGTSLHKIVREFDQKRGMVDASYLAAYIVSQFKGGSMLDVGIEHNISPWAEFVYLVNPEAKTVTSYTYDGKKLEVLYEVNIRPKHATEKNN